MSEWRGRKRFYQTVAVAPANAGYVITLDGKPVQTPAGQEFDLASHDLAQAVAAEWQAQQEDIAPATMPMFRLALTAIDRVGPRRAETIEISLTIAKTDMLCYRAEQPPDLAVRQADQWQPLLNWAAVNLAAEMQVTSGIVPVTQPDGALDALRRVLTAMDDHQLTATSNAAAASSSLILPWPWRGGTSPLIKSQNWPCSTNATRTSNGARIAKRWTARPAFAAKSARRNVSSRC